MSTDYRAIMRLIVDGYSYAEIQRSLGCSSKSVATAKKVVSQLGLDAVGVAGLTDAVIGELFPDARTGRDAEFAPIPMEAILNRFKSSSKNVTIKVEWEAYRRDCVAAGTKAYGLSQFYRIVEKEITSRNLSWPLHHEPGHTMFVDWSGDKMWVGVPGDSDSFQVSIFVASLPYSGMFFAKAFANERTPHWIQAHVDALEYFGGVPTVIVPDNASTASFRPRKGDLEREVCTSYRQFGDYYKAGIVPAAPNAPRHKAHVENSVGISQNWLNEFLARHTYDSLDDLNEAIFDQVEWINHVKTPYRGIDAHTRFAEFVAYEQHALNPLPQGALGVCGLQDRRCEA